LRQQDPICEPGSVSERRCPGGAPTGVGEDSFEAPIPARRDDRAARHAARDGGRAPEAGEEGAEEEDGEEAHARSMGRRPGRTARR
jgi:hypothetical protein